MFGKFTKKKDYDEADTTSDISCHGINTGTFNNN